MPYWDHVEDWVNSYLYSQLTTNIVLFIIFKPSGDKNWDDGYITGQIEAISSPKIRFTISD